MLLKSGPAIPMIAAGKINANIHLRSGRWFKQKLLAVQNQIRRRTSASGEKLKLLDRLSLGGKRSLAIVSFNGRHYLVAMGGDGVPALTEVRDAADRENTFGYTRIHRSRLRVTTYAGEAQ